MKCNEWSKYYKIVENIVENIVYASYDKIRWFFYTDMECC